MVRSGKANPQRAGKAVPLELLNEAIRNAAGLPFCRYSGHKLVTNQFLVSRGKLFIHQVARISH